MQTIAELFAEYQNLTSDHCAAATLVLAHCTLNREPTQAMLDLTAVAKRLAVSTDTVRKLHRSGKLVATKVGRKLRFDPKMVAQYEREASGNPLPKFNSDYERKLWGR